MAHIHIHLVPKRTASTVKDSVESAEKAIAQQQRLIDGCIRNGRDVPPILQQRLMFLKEELAKEKAKKERGTEDSKEETTDADEKIGLWQYTESTNSWRLIRSCTPETSKEWLTTMKGREPKEIFVLSKTRPASKPSN